MRVFLRSHHHPTGGRFAIRDSRLVRTHQRVYARCPVDENPTMARPNEKKTIRNHISGFVPKSDHPLFDVYRYHRRLRSSLPLLLQYASCSSSSSSRSSGSSSSGGRSTIAIAPVLLNLSTKKTLPKTLRPKNLPSSRSPQRKMRKNGWQTPGTSEMVRLRVPTENAV